MLLDAFQMVYIHCRIFWLSHHADMIKFTDVSEEIAASFLWKVYKTNESALNCRYHSTANLKFRHSNFKRYPTSQCSSHLSHLNSYIQREIQCREIDQVLENLVSQVGWPD
jgi:hypothetical protein